MTDSGTRHPSLEGTEIADSVLDLIGETPMVRMRKVSEDQGIGCSLVMKTRGDESGRIVEGSSSARDDPGRRGER